MRLATQVSLTQFGAVQAMQIMRGKVFLRGCLVIIGAALVVGPTAWAQDASDTSTEAKAATFTNLQAVTITGHNQDAMEPFLTRDGRVLFFNNSNAPTIDTNLFWATKVDDLTFQLQGEIAGVNGPALDAVASMDLSNNFYFVSTRSYDTTLSTIYSGNYSKGSVSGPAIVAGVSPARRGFVDFDQEVSADGNTLYFAEGLFTGGSVPASSEVLVAHRNDNGFMRDGRAKEILRTINRAGRLNYAVCTSADELEIFFTRLNGKEPAILMASRTSTARPFGAAEKIPAITGFVEAPTISPDGRSLYFHRRNPDGVFSIYRVTRP
jgi:WD40 repeat protein